MGGGVSKKKSVLCGLARIGAADQQGAPGEAKGRITRAKERNRQEPPMPRKPPTTGQCSKFGSNGNVLKMPIFCSRVPLSCVPDTRVGYSYLSFFVRMCTRLFSFSVCRTFPQTGLETLYFDFVVRVSRQTIGLLPRLLFPTDLVFDKYLTPRAAPWASLQLWHKTARLVRERDGNAGKLTRCVTEGPKVKRSPTLGRKEMSEHGKKPCVCLSTHVYRVCVWF